MNYTRLRCEARLVGGARINGLSLKYIGHPYIVEILPQAVIEKPYAPECYEMMELKTTAPLEMVTDFDNTPENLLSWVQKYGIPSNRISYVFEEPKTLDTGEVLHDVLYVPEFQSEYSRLALAVRVWEGIASRNMESLRALLEYQDGRTFACDGISPLNGSPTKVSYTVSLDNYADMGAAFLNDDKATLQIAGQVLMQEVNSGTHRYPSLDLLTFASVESDNSKNLPFQYAKKASSRSTMGYIWSVIRNDISEKGFKAWHYKRCADCGVWEDLSLPGHRNTWTRCDPCAAKRKTELARLRQQRKRAGLPTSS